jgi:hypothetical protein
LAIRTADIAGHNRRTLGSSACCFDFLLARCAVQNSTEVLQADDKNLKTINETATEDL